jgi:hypothetical protein
MATLNISLTVPDDKATDIVTSITDYYGWNTDLGIARPAFLKQLVRDYVRQLYRSSKASQANAAVVQATADADAVSMT